MFDNLRLKSQVEFIVEIDKLKQVLRQTVTTDKSRQENSAEHSWHIALMSFLLSEYADSVEIEISGEQCFPAQHVGLRFDKIHFFVDMSCLFIYNSVVKG